MDHDSPNFLTDGTAYIVGYIRNYDPSSSLKTGLINYSNVITNEDSPITVEIQPDGRFEAVLPISYPHISAITLGRVPVRFYVEQGQTTAVVMDPAVYPNAIMSKANRWTGRGLEFMGPLAQINRDILNVDWENGMLDSSGALAASLGEKGMVDHYKGMLQRNLAKIEAQRSDGTIGPSAATILVSLAYGDFAVSLLRYESSIMVKVMSGDSSARFPDSSFYEFIRDLPMNDQKLLLSDPSGMINALAFASIFKGTEAGNKTIGPKMQLLDFMAEKHNIDMSEFKAPEDFQSLSEEEKKDVEKRMQAKFNELIEKYSGLVTEWEKLYVKPMFMEREKLKWHVDDSIYTALGRDTDDLIYQILKVYGIDFSFKNMDADLAASYAEWIADRLKHPFLKKEVFRILDKVYSQDSEVVSELPEGRASEIFRKIIEPFAGKTIFVDFWGTTCGPCIASIRSSAERRLELEKRDDLALVYITDVTSSPDKAKYEEFIKENNMKHSFRISRDDWNYMMQLFNFLGIPHYELIDSRGRVVNSKYASYGGLEEYLRILE